MGHRDVISDGFNVDKRVDAIFLDLPIPWDGIPHAQRTLKRGKQQQQPHPHLFCYLNRQRLLQLSAKKLNNVINYEVHGQVMFSIQIAKLFATSSPPYLVK